MQARVRQGGPGRRPPGQSDGLSSVVFYYSCNCSSRTTGAAAGLQVPLQTVRDRHQEGAGAVQVHARGGLHSTELYSKVFFIATLHYCVIFQLQSDDDNDGLLDFFEFKVAIKYAQRKLKSRQESGDPSY